MITSAVWGRLRCPRRAGLLALPGLPGLIVLPAALVVAGVIVVLARVRVLRAAVPAFGRLVVPAALLTVTVVAGISLVQDAVAILD